VYSLDVTQAFLQSAERLQREIIIRPDVLELRKDDILQVLRSLYGLSESGDYWAENLRNHMLNKLQLKQSAADMSLFFRQKGRELSEMVGSYVDNLLCASPRELKKKNEREFTEQFEFKNSRYLPTTFLGMDLAKMLTGFVSGMQNTFCVYAICIRTQALRNFAHYVQNCCGFTMRDPILQRAVQSHLL
jgi:Reverse transcriptase (RNA-dependent DNA polymerase)